MKKTLLLLLVLTIPGIPIKLIAQSVLQTDLKPGAHKVGFIHETRFDRSRTFFDERNQVDTDGYRPMNLGIWYPAVVQKNDKPVIYSDYVNYFKIEKGSSDADISSFINTAAPEKELESATWAYHSPETKSGSFPVVIYAASFNAPTFENSVLFEYLASHGYVVISIPSQGHDSFPMTADLKGIEAQTRDIEWVIGQLDKFPYADPEQLTVLGFSWGGLTNVMAKMRHDQIKALISMDGSIAYFYDLFETSPYADMSKLDVPFLFLGQNNFEMDRVSFRDSTYLFGDFYTALTNSEANLVHFAHMAHQNFASHFIKLRARNPDVDSNQERINKGYSIAVTYIHNFLDAHIKNKNSAKEFLLKSPTEIDASSELIKIIRKSPN